MSILKCLICQGEVEIIGNLDEFTKKIRCLGCGFENCPKKEIVVYKKRSKL